MYNYDKEETKKQESVSLPEFVRGTTPEFVYTLFDLDGNPLDLSQFETISVTLAQKGKEAYHCTITLKDGIAIDGNAIHFTLDEPQSLRFEPGLIAIQIYGKNKEDRSWATLAEDVTVRVRKSLKDGDIVE